MLGVSGVIDNSSDHGTAAVEARDCGGGASGGSSEAGQGSFSEDDKGIKIEESERTSGGNRWPRQETLALLKIRSDMDIAFRDSGLKGPLWEEISRKMADLGYHRSAKKCKEKFENVYKYHKRTKDGRASKSDGKTYRFFDQLEALENNPSSHPLPPPNRHQAPKTTTMAMPISMSAPNTTTSQYITNVSPLIATTTNPIQPPLTAPPPPSAAPLNHIHKSMINPPSNMHMSMSLMSNSTSSSTSSDEDIERRHRRKRKWKDFFDRLMKDVVEKQEDMQRKFLDTLERRERDRIAREEAWRVQEMARMNREHDLLVQERSIAAAKDAAVIAFLQKITEQQNPQTSQNTNNNAFPSQVQVQVLENSLRGAAQPQAPPQPYQQPVPPQPLPPAPAPAPALAPEPLQVRNMDTFKIDNGVDNYLPAASSSRWPKAEVQALIQLRTNLDTKYQENGPKGPLWEEISSGMRKLGYNRNSKRCKEKWENINKYFKKVKESNKKRPEDSKTCPYFHQLDALYKEKTKNESSTNPGYASSKPESLVVPIMATPEQQWPLQQEQQQQQQQRQQQQEDQDHESENIDQSTHESDDEGDEEDEEDEGGANYELVTNKPTATVG